MEEESLRAERRLDDIAVRHYRAYIDAAECYAAVRRETKDAATLLETLEAQLPDLKRGCEAYVKGAREIGKARGMNRTLMNNAGAVGDLLEVPKLLDACVRNGHYDEALDLENFVAKMETTHGDIGLIRKLAEEARASSAEMLRALLGRLRVKIQLPECLRTVGYLRRLSAYDETTLRRTFLSCREEYIARYVAELDDSNPYDYLKKLTDTHRVALFDLVMQYRAIFSDDAEGEASREGSALLYSWATHRISKYVELVEATLPRVFEGGALASVYEHCEYCGTSLARVGLDTRPLLRPVFAAAAVAVFDAALASAGDDFERALESSTLWSSATPSTPNESTDADPDAPPASLAEHPPLAALVNGVLLAHNELRHLTPVLDLRGPLTSSMESTLARATAALHAAHTAADAECAADASARASRDARARAYLDVTVPFFARAFARLIGDSSDFRFAASDLARDAFTDVASSA